MPVPTMAVPVPVEPMQAAAKTAIGRGATFNEPSIRAARSIGNASGSAIYPRHKTHRYGADGRGTHHGQDDTARTFHRHHLLLHMLGVLGKPSPDIQALIFKLSH